MKQLADKLIALYSENDIDFRAVDKLITYVKTQPISNQIAIFTALYDSEKYEEDDYDLISYLYEQQRNKIKKLREQFILMKNSLDEFTQTYSDEISDIEETEYERMYDL